MEDHFINRLDLDRRIVLCAALAAGLAPIEIGLAPDLIPRFARRRPVIAIEP